MTTAEIIARANASSLGSSDLDLERELRMKIIPKFFADVDRICGRLWWRTRIYSQAVTANDRDYQLPLDFGSFLEIGTSEGTDLTYLGETTQEVLDAELGETNVAYGFYILPPSTGSVDQPVLYLAFVPAADFTMKGVMAKRIPWADYTTAVDLNPYIPTDWQWALVESARESIATDRFAAGDKRAGKYKSEYEGWIERIRGNKTKSPASSRRMLLMR